MYRRELILDVFRRLEKISVKASIAAWAVRSGSSAVMVKSSFGFEISEFRTN
jgi:hypothetical protein